MEAGDIAQVLILAAVGAAQPFLQAFLIRFAIHDTAAQLVTWGLSAAIAVVAVWLTGGLAGIGDGLPAFKLDDPSAFVGALGARTAAVRLAAAIAYQAFNSIVRRTGGLPPKPSS